MDEEQSIESIFARKLYLWGMITGGLVLSLILTFVITLGIGAVGISAEDIINVFIGSDDFIKVLTGGHASTPTARIVLEVRLPRILTACLVGSSLAVSGAAMQGLFRNPMASPYILGISSGAAFGASLALVLGFSIISGEFAVPAMAFIFCFITVFLVYGVSRTKGQIPVETLLLAGIAVGAFFTALVSLMKYFAGEKLESIVFWMMGGLWNSNWDMFWAVLPFIVIGCFILMIYSRDLNALMVGEEQAVNLGINVPVVRTIILLAASLVTAAAVAVSGIIGFVGLIVPHMIRILIGPDHRLLIPTSIIVGAIFMIWMDTLARTIIAPQELPVGIITALLGAPFFLFLLRSRRKEMGW